MDLLQLPVPDDVLLRLFDEFRPFNVHNRTMRALKDRLGDPHIQADTVQKKCLSLIFEGSGVRNVFESHVGRLKAIREERQEEGRRESCELHCFPFVSSGARAVMASAWIGFCMRLPSA